MMLILVTKYLITVSQRWTRKDTQSGRTAEGKKTTRGTAAATAVVTAMIDVIASLR